MGCRLSYQGTVTYNGSQALGFSLSSSAGVEYADVVLLSNQHFAIDKRYCYTELQLHRLRGWVADDRAMHSAALRSFNRHNRKLRRDFIKGRKNFPPLVTSIAA